MDKLFDSVITSQISKYEIHQQKLISLTMSDIESKKNKKMIIFSVPLDIDGFTTTWTNVMAVLKYIMKGFNGSTKDSEFTLVQLKHVSKGMFYSLTHKVNEWYEYETIVDFDHGVTNNLFALKLKSMNYPEMPLDKGKADSDFIRNLLYL
ncbi:MAG: hypothetical protein Barrevirus6_12 [Barrevirus sp.]|uniref:Uncharacterized protein n=1 Tax=Barrevirus sp. TaxID=2487763 RepID=A0A3G4ZRL9_9VIRU|nr:MAG: hypothetical protein Barrevirus6_12 [Barrevirus sp.]